MSHESRGRTIHTQARGDDRQVRVFISSTFRDMQAERDYLVKFIFPKLRKLCESRGVTWGEVDLRWGITDEQSDEGQMLPICLAEIERSRPYFVGLLGERYGWTLDEIDPELVAQEPWLEEYKGHSVTELEILHGVLNDPEMADRTLFYFRDPAYLETLDRFQLDDFIEVPWREEIEKYGIVVAQQRVELRKHRLAALKERIRRSGLLLKENYQDPEELGEWVLEDMTAIIERIFPQGSQPDPLTQEALLHEAFARSRAGVYIGGEKYFQALDRHIKDSRQPLAVVGESGSGKSTLLANWALKRRAEHPDALVLMHFIGASAGSTELASLLARLMGELKEHFEIPEELPGTEEALRRDFPNWLYMAAAQGRGVLILDGLNQLEERIGAQELDWLPLEMPEQIQLILSTLPCRALDVIDERGWSSLAVEPLTIEERAQLVHDYLGQSAKKLNSARVERIVRDPQSENPLSLRILLDELRQFGVHKELDAVIDHYLAADSIPEMYQLILERCEGDYEGKRPGLVRDALTYICAARRGLSEAELLDLLGEGGQPLPHRTWSPLHLALEGSLVDRGGLLDFFHDYIRQAIEERYLPSENEKERAHLRLADYFERQTLVPRKVDELPWQLTQAKDWDRLYLILADLTFFERLWMLSEVDAKSYWFELEGNSNFSKTSCYEEALSDTEANPDALHYVATLFADTGHPERAAAIWEALMARYSGTPFTHEVFKGAYAVALLKGGRIADGLRVLEEQARYTEVDFSLLQVQCATLGNLGMALCHIGESDRALHLFQDQETLARRIKDVASLRISVSNQATILARQQRLDEALGASLEAERLCREAGDMSGLATSLGNQGLILLQWHRHIAAKKKLDQANEIFEGLGDTSNVATLLGARAAVLLDRNELGEALTLLEKQKSLCESSGHALGRATACANIATLLYRLGRKDEAMSLAKEVIQVATSNGYHEVAKHMSNVVREWNG